MAEKESNWQIWAVVWYGALVLMAVFSYKFGHFRLSLVAIVVLSLYGFILFSTKSLAGKAHRYNKVHPWAILGLGLLLAYTGDRWWLPEPKFDSVVAEHNPFEIPLGIERINLDMSAADVESAIGKPTLRQRHHFGDIRQLDTEDALMLATAMDNVAGGHANISSPESTQLLEVLKSRTLKPKGDIFHGNQNWVMDLLNRADSGQRLDAILVDGSLSKETAQKALRGLEEEQLNANNLLLVTSSGSSPYSGLFIENLVLGYHWRYAKLDLDILFEGTDNQTIVAVSGGRVSIGREAWSQVGQPLQTLHSPGRPLEDSSASLFRDSNYETFEKEWGPSELRVGASLDRIERLEVWRREKSTD